MARKVLLIVASLTLVIAGAGLYLSMTKSNASPISGEVTVFVATGDLGPGTEGSALTEPQVQRVQVASNLAPPNALTNLAQIAGLQTTVPIFKGQILMARMFATASATGGLLIPPGTNAITLELTDPGRVAGFVQPGSKVVVYGSGPGIGDGPIKVILKEAPVIAVGPTTASGKGGDGVVSNKGVPIVLITFALSPADSVKVVLHSSGPLALGLLPN